MPLDAADHRADRDAGRASRLRLGRGDRRSATDGSRSPGSEVELETRADPFTRADRARARRGRDPGPDRRPPAPRPGGPRRCARWTSTETATLEDGLASGRATPMRALADPDAWLDGHGWDADRWGRWPTADDLERVAPGRRVMLWAHDHHALLASHAALRTGGVSTRDRRIRPGGVIRRDATTGRPRASSTRPRPASSSIHLPASDQADLEAAHRDRRAGAGRRSASSPPRPGRASRPDPDLAFSFPAYAHLAETGRLPLRVHACVRDDALDTAIAGGLRSGDVLGADPARPRPGRLAEVLRRWVDGLADRGPARGHRARARSAAAAGPPPRRLDHATRRAARTSPRGRRRPASRRRSTRSATRRSGPRSTS